MASSPSYNPNTLADRGAFAALNHDQEGAPLVNRATQNGYPPGSTMKVVTAAAALDTGRFNPQSVVNGANGKEISGVPLNNCGRGGLRRHRPHLRADELGQHRLGPGRRVAGRSHHAALHGALRLLRGAAARLSRRADVGVGRPQGRAARADDVRPRRRRPRRDRPGRPLRHAAPDGHRRADDRQRRRAPQAAYHGQGRRSRRPDRRRGRARGGASAWCRPGRRAT